MLTIVDGFCCCWFMPFDKTSIFFALLEYVYRSDFAKKEYPTVGHSKIAQYLGSHQTSWLVNIPMAGRYNLLCL